MSESNGHAPPPLPGPPALTVAWDAAAQAASLTFDHGHFKTWDMVIAVLDMARRQAEDARRGAILAGMQRHMQEAAQGRALAAALGGPRGQLIH